MHVYEFSCECMSFLNFLYDNCLVSKVFHVYACDMFCMHMYAICFACHLINDFNSLYVSYLNENPIKK